jgi:hypothetical protein
LILLGAAMLAQARAHAETHRLAIVVGNNQGAKDQPRLRFSEADAAKVGRLFVELGGVAPSDLFLLQGRGLADLEHTLAAARDRVAEWARVPEARVFLLFYFSGHSDGQALDLGEEQLPFDQLKTWLASSGADLRLIVVDSCRSGALFTRKGGTPIEPFEIHLVDDLGSAGEAMITSSAADESSLESAEIRGSFFTHHLISGLRGAADTSRDDRVTLAEAYQYAFARTAATTAGTLAGAQHPSYEYRLSGQGDVALTELRARSAGLTVPAGFGRVLISEPAHNQVVAEITASTRTRLALPPGAYRVQAWKGTSGAVVDVALADGEEQTLRDAEWKAMPRPATTLKGSGVADAAVRSDVRSEAGENHPLIFFGGAGATTGVARSLGAMVAARIDVRSSRPAGPSLALEAAAGRGSYFGEQRITALAGYGLTRSRGALSGSAGARAGLGYAAQQTSSGASTGTAIAVLAPYAGASWWMTPWIALNAEIDVQGGLYLRNGARAVSLWPAGFVGVALSR